MFCLPHGAPLPGNSMPAGCVDAHPEREPPLPVPKSHPCLPYRTPSCLRAVNTTGGRYSGAEARCPPLNCQAGYKMCAPKGICITKASCCTNSDCKLPGQTCTHSPAAEASCACKAGQQSCSGVDFQQPLGCVSIPTAGQCCHDSQCPAGHRCAYGRNGNAYFKDCQPCAKMRFPQPPYCAITKSCGGREQSFGARCCTSQQCFDPEWKPGYCNTTAHRCTCPPGHEHCKGTCAKTRGATFAEKCCRGSMCAAGYVCDMIDRWCLCAPGSEWCQAQNVTTKIQGRCVKNQSQGYGAYCCGPANCHGTMTCSAADTCVCPEDFTWHTGLKRCVEHGSLRYGQACTASRQCGDGGGADPKLVGLAVCDPATKKCACKAGSTYCPAALAPLGACLPPLYKPPNQAILSTLVAYGGVCCPGATGQCWPRSLACGATKTCGCAAGTVYCQGGGCKPASQLFAAGSRSAGWSCCRHEECTTSKCVDEQCACPAGQKACSGKCVAAAGVDAPSSSRTQGQGCCSSSQCRSGLVCSQSTNNCQPDVCPIGEVKCSTASASCMPLAQLQENGTMWYGGSCCLDRECESGKCRATDGTCTCPAGQTVCSSDLTKCVPSAILSAAAGSRQEGQTCCSDGQCYGPGRGMVCAWQGCTPGLACGAGTNYCEKVDGGRCVPEDTLLEGSDCCSNRNCAGNLGCSQQSSKCACSAGLSWNSRADPPSCVADGWVAPGGSCSADVQCGDYEGHKPGMACNATTHVCDCLQAPCGARDGEGALPAT